MTHEAELRCPLGNGPDDLGGWRVIDAYDSNAPTRTFGGGHHVARE
jgi:hypothetical protein